MTRIPRHRRPRPNALRPRWEQVESRIVLSAVLSVDPAPGASFVRSPAALHVAFAQPIASFSVGFGDVVLDRVEDDGTLSPTFADDEPPLEELDPDGSGLTFTFSAPLQPGRYRMLLSGDSGLVAEDGTPLSPGDGLDEPLGDFTIARPGVGLADATDLGTVGTVPTSVRGTLDFTADSGDVRLYKITLPEGHFWRLGLEVTAQRDGGELNSALALFDSQGRPLATDDAGRPDAPFDPYLFAGLTPGTYYVGVSGTNDLPGTPGGYDPAASSSGVTQPQAGGPFTLHLVADEADRPGVLRGFRLEHADPLDPNPTGLSVRFSTALALGDSGSRISDRAAHGLDLVDQDGRSWPIAAVSYDEMGASLNYLFRDRLPAGRYTLRLAATSPLADLAGLSPVSPGQPDGVLASFTVGLDLRTRRADGSLAIPDSLLDPANGGPASAPGTAPRTEDLGPLTPDLVLGGLTRSVTIRPGETVVFRFVSLSRDFYKLGLHLVGGSVRVDVNGAEGMTTSLDPATQGQDHSLPAGLAPGAYLVRFTATGDAPVEVTATLGIEAFSWDSILFNGLGQGPALNLRLVANGGDDPAPVDPPSVPGPPVAPPTLPPPGPTIEPRTPPVPGPPVAPPLAPPPVPSPLAPPPVPPVAPPTPPPPGPSLTDTPSPVLSPPAATPPPTAAGRADGPMVEPDVAAGASTKAGESAGAGSGNDREDRDSPPSSTGSSSLSRGPSGLPFEIGGVPVGRPSADADHVAAVGPASASGTVALAFASGGVGQPITSAPSLLAAFSPGMVAPSEANPFVPAFVIDGSLRPESSLALGVAEESIGEPLGRDPASEPAESDLRPVAPAGVPGDSVPAGVVDTSVRGSAPGAADTGPEAEEEAAGISTWLVALAGVATLGATIAYRRWKFRRHPAAVAPSRVPAPHPSPALERV